jgi:hypothetical protein
LDFSINTNDGNGLIEGFNYNQGLAQLERDLLAAFPNLALGAEETNDSIAPWESFSQPLYWSSGGSLNPSATPPVPVSAYVLGNVNRYWHLGAPSAYDVGFLPDLAQYEGQAVLPTLTTAPSNFTQVDEARWVGVAAAFQKNNLQPAWDTPWNGVEMKYHGANNVSASTTDSGSLAQFSVQQAGTSTALYRFAHNVNQIDSPYSVRNWPAFNGTVTLGLDPAIQYWLDMPNFNPALHISALPSGARLSLGTGTLVTSQFANFQVLPPATPPGYDFLVNFGQATQGITLNGVDGNGVDGPLSNGAFVNLQTITVGGVARHGISCYPPWMAPGNGATYVEYSVAVPSTADTMLQFAAGIDDSDIGQRLWPMTFAVSINGATLWQLDVSTGGWQAGSIDMGPWLGQTVKVRFWDNSGPTGNSSFANGVWSALPMTVPFTETLYGINVANATSNVAVTGGSASTTGTSVTVNGLPYNGTALVFTGQPVTVAAHQSLLNFPFTLSQSATGQLAGPNVKSCTSAQASSLPLLPAATRRTKHSTHSPRNSARPADVGAHQRQRPVAEEHRPARLVAVWRGRSLRLGRQDRSSSN